MRALRALLLFARAHVQLAHVHHEPAELHRVRNGLARRLADAVRIAALTLEALTHQQRNARRVVLQKTQRLRVRRAEKRVPVQLKNRQTDDAL